MDREPLPLEGAKVVDLSRLLPGPWCSPTFAAIYPTRDGKAVTIALLETARWHRVLSFVGRYHLIQEDSLADRHSDHGERAKLYRETIAALCTAHDRDELTRRMMAAGIAICPAYTPDEVMTSVEAKGRGLVRTLEHPFEGCITQIVDPLTRSGLADSTRRLAPRLGEHGEELRRDLVVPRKDWHS